MQVAGVHESQFPSMYGRSIKKRQQEVKKITLTKGMDNFSIFMFFKVKIVIG
jgi:hypothetical protein